MVNKYFNKSLKIENYTIGYSQEGESVLIILKMDEVAIYTIVIDSYNHNNNITYTCLKKQEIQHIDLLCWTHPDKDHSIGLEDYMEFIDFNTTILVADGFSETKEIWEKANPQIYKLIEKELCKGMTCKNKIKIRKVCQGMVIKKISIVDARNSVEYPFEVSVFSPSDYQTLRRSMRTMKLQNNFMSVGIIVKVGTLVNIYSADTPNVIFNNFDIGEFPEMVDFIKIPHHCSLSSSAILKLIENKPKVACTTVNIMNHLPNKELLNQYKKKLKKYFVRII
ncbi:hypothetical protein [Lacrimispora xylanisolvens]|uniref:hypothetical protein n=1 Tax=Lacrimispora xylanisolvens TaxID=384636 RepID=UPI00240264C0